MQELSDVVVRTGYSLSCGADQSRCGNTIEGKERSQLSLRLKGLEWNLGVRMKALRVPRYLGSSMARKGLDDVVAP